MIYHAYSLYDEKAGAFSPPFFVASEGLALRAVSDVVKDPNTTPGRHPNDFVLYEVGAFDDFTGQFDAIKPRPICKAASLLPPQQALPLDPQER